MLLIGGMSKEYELNSIDAFRTRLAYLKMTDDMQPDTYLSLVAKSYLKRKTKIWNQFKKIVKIYICYIINAINLILNYETII